MSVEVICKQVSEASLRPARIRREDVRRWQLSHDPRVTDRLCALLVEKGSRLQALVVEDLLAEIVPRLLELVQHPVDEPSPYESLRYLRLIFEDQWKSRDEATLAQIVDGLASLLMDWPNSNDLVIQVVTEHLFQIAGVVELFESWRSHPRLNAALEESVRLAELWRSGKAGPD